MKTDINLQEFELKCTECMAKNSLAPYAAPRIIRQLYDMTSYMLEVNSVMNLTAITDIDEIIVKHLVDSLTIAPYIPEKARLLDVGCGGGFPSLPLAIARPDIKITSLDSTAKKTAYVEQAAKKLGLDNLSILTGRAEDFAHETSYREQFDCVTARAVAALPVLAELCIPFIKIGGKLIAMKGKPASDELTDAPSILGASQYTIQTLILESKNYHEHRTLFFAEKLTHTKKDYPRAYAQIKKNPL